MPRADGPAVVILAGGEATRFPGKLESDLHGVPLLLRVYANVAQAGSVYLSANRTFPPEIDAALRCPVIVDRQPGRGPLSGLASAFSVICEPYAYAVAADMPFVDARTLEELRAAWEPGLQAVVPENARGLLEPLCALYDRAAFLAAALQVLQKSSGGVRAVVELLNHKRLRLTNERAFSNVNTPSDRELLLHDRMGT